MNRFLLGIIAIGFATPNHAADAPECLRINVQPNGDVAITTACADVLNVMYCIDGLLGEQTCDKPVKRIVSLTYGTAEIIPGYSAAGKPPIYSAACFYPEAPVEWKQQRNGAYACKKTCVMC